eukprot:scaffold1878_cov355-Prasinococcus_capsulatus_cf.AAC.9
MDGADGQAAPICVHRMASATEASGRGECPVAPVESQLLRACPHTRSTCWRDGRHGRRVRWIGGRSACDAAEMGGRRPRLLTHHHRLAGGRSRVHQGCPLPRCLSVAPPDRPGACPRIRAAPSPSGAGPARAAEGRHDPSLLALLLMMMTSDAPAHGAGDDDHHDDDDDDDHHHLPRRRGSPRIIARAGTVLRERRTGACPSPRARPPSGSPR